MSASGDKSLLKSPIFWVIFIVNLKGLESIVVTRSPAATFDSWTDAGNVWKHVALPHSSVVSRIAHEIKEDPNVKLSVPCRRSLSRFSEGLLYGDETSHRLLDSFAKFSSGFLESERFIDFGHYEQCLDQKGRYVLLKIHFPLPLSKEFGRLKHAAHQGNSSWIISTMSSSYLMFYTVTPLAGICLPESCSQQDAHNIIESELITNLTQPLQLEIESTEADSDDQFPDHKLLRFVSRSVILLLITSMLIGTLFPSQHFLLKHFDAKKNTEKIFQESSNPRLEFFNGFKTIYFLVCLFAHFGTPITPTLVPFTMEISHYITKTPFLVVLAKVGFVIVAINFVVSACLSVMSWMPEIEKRKGKLSLSTYLFLRITRTMPVTLVCVLVNYCFPLVSYRSGPLMNHIQRNLTELCIENGWKEITFVANAGIPVYNCSTISWYASSDMQLYTVSFLTLILLYKRPKLGIYLTIFQVFLGALIQGLVIWYDDVSPSVVMFLTNDIQRLMLVFRTIYIQGYNNLSAYAIGILLGYSIVKDIQLPQEWRRFCWFLSTFLLVGTMSIPVFLYDGLDFNGSRSLEIVVGALFKTGCSAGLAGLLFMCWVEPDSWLARKLSAKIFTPIARISFSMFMTHPFLIIFMLGMQRQPFYMSHMEVLTKTLYLIFASIFLGYFTFITVEAPFFNLVKELLSSKKQKSQEVNNNAIPGKKVM